MKRIIRSVFLGALLFGQQAFAQDSVQNSIQAPAKDRKQELSHGNRQKNPFYMPRLSIEKIIQNLSYQSSRDQGSDFLLRNNQEPSNELEDFVFENSVLRRVNEISKDNKPFQLYNGRITLTLSSSRQNFSQGNAFKGNQFYVTRNKASPFYGLLRWLGKIKKK